MTTHPSDQHLATPPDYGTTTAVFDDLLWSRLPFDSDNPFLDHVNIWLLDQGQGYLAVDAGPASALGEKYWQQLFAGPLNSKPLKTLLCSHWHIDHTGLLAFLQRTCEPDFWMTRAEWRETEAHHENTRPARNALETQMLEMAGMPADQASKESPVAIGVSSIEGEISPPSRFLTKGQKLTIGARNWQIITGGGHSPEAACLYEPEAGLLLPSDQILPHIAPYIGVAGSDPLGDPLGDYLAFLHQLQQFSNDILVLPGHGLPFRGVASRAAKLQHGHTRRLERLLQAATLPMQCIDFMPVLVRPSQLNPPLAILVSIALAHLNHLVEQGQMNRWLEPDNIYRYQKN